MPRALVLGGTGAIGRATTTRLLAAGWEVDLTGRDPTHMPASLTTAGARFHAAAPAGVPDVLVDCACFTAEDAERLLPLARDAGSTVMISSKAVYVDAEGRHSNTDEPPRFDGPVAETQPTMAPSRADHTTREGYGANKVAAEQVLLDSGLPVTVLRPSKVHGAGARLAREWVFVKRALDRRPVVLLAHRGEGGDHPSGAVNIAALIEVVAARPGTRILNAADPDAPNGLEISRAIARRLGHERDEILLDDDAPASLGRHPWDRRPPVVLDTAAALALGYTPVGDYATTVADVVDWLVEGARGGEDAALLPPPYDPAFALLLDYAAEDAYLRSHESLV